VSLFSLLLCFFASVSASSPLHSYPFEVLSFFYMESFKAENFIMVLQLGGWVLFYPIGCVSVLQKLKINALFFCADEEEEQKRRLS